MITAVDTSVLLDVLNADPDHGRASVERLQAARSMGAVVASEVVFAEVSSCFASADQALETLGSMEIAFSPTGLDAALEAGRIFAAYRKKGGRRPRMVADFLVGAHALEQTDQLLTRDRGFYRGYFKRLKLA